MVNHDKGLMGQQTPAAVLATIQHRRKVMFDDIRQRARTRDQQRRSVEMAAQEEQHKLYREANARKEHRQRRVDDGAGGYVMEDLSGSYRGDSSQRTGSGVIVAREERMSRESEPLLSKGADSHIHSSNPLQAPSSSGALTQQLRAQGATARDKLQGHTNGAAAQARKSPTEGVQPSSAGGQQPDEKPLAKRRTYHHNRHRSTVEEMEEVADVLQHVSGLRRYQ